MVKVKRLLSHRSGGDCQGICDAMFWGQSNISCAMGMLTFQRVTISNSGEVSYYPLAALCRSASITASNFCCSASRVSTVGSSDLLAWSFSDFGRLAFCRNSSQEDRVAMLRECSARISSQRLLRWEGCAGPNTNDKFFCRDL